MKKEVAGLGVIYEINKPKMEYIDDDLPPPPPELLRDFNDEDPIYANVTRNGPPSSHPPLPTKGIKPGDKLYHARPYNLESTEELTNRPHKSGVRVDSFSSSSSDASSPSTTKTSPTPYTRKNASPSAKVPDVDNEGSFNSEGGRNLLHEAMKNPIIPAGKTCENCKDILNTGEVAISAERAGPVKIWHPRCFKCHDCKVIDLYKYFL